MNIYLFLGWRIHTWLLMYFLGLPNFLHVLTYFSLAWWCWLWFVFQVKKAIKTFLPPKKKQSPTKRKATGCGQHTLLAGQSAHRKFEPCHFFPSCRLWTQKSHSVFQARSRYCWMIKLLQEIHGKSRHLKRSAGAADKEHGNVDAVLPQHLQCQPLALQSSFLAPCSPC